MAAGRSAFRLGASAASRGFTFVWILAALVIMSIGLAASGPIWMEQAQRERESDLLRIGSLYAEAIARYRESSPGTLKQWPSSLDDLLVDPRFAGTVRHMRRLYADPLDPTRPWTLIRAPGGGILGIRSQSVERPLRREPQQVGNVTLPSADRYDQWAFMAPTQ